MFPSPGADLHFDACAATESAPCTFSSKLRCALSKVRAHQQPLHKAIPLRHRHFAASRARPPTQLTSSGGHTLPQLCLRGTGAMRRGRPAQRRQRRVLPPQAAGTRLPLQPPGPAAQLPEEEDAVQDTTAGAFGSRRLCAVPSRSLSITSLPNPIKNVITPPSKHTKCYTEISIILSQDFFLISLF